MHGLLEQVPRWFLLALVIVLLPASTTFGTFSFHFVMHYLAEAKTANTDPIKQEVAAIVTRVSRLEGRVSAIEMELPPLARKVDKIDANVERLLSRRR